MDPHDVVNAKRAVGKVKQRIHMLRLVFLQRSVAHKGYVSSSAPSFSRLLFLFLFCSWILVLIDIHLIMLHHDSPSLMDHEDDNGAGKPLPNFVKKLWM